MALLIPACTPRVPLSGTRGLRSRHATAIAPAVAAPDPGGLATVTLRNWSGSDSPALHVMGHPFARGDVPGGHTVAARRLDTGEDVACVLDGPCSWDDGSLAFAGLILLDDTGPVPAGGSRGYELRAVPGPRAPAAASGFDPWAWLAANTDLRVELTGMATSAGVAMSPDSRPISLNTHLATATRRTRHLDHARVQVLKVWGMAASDGHLKGEHFVTIFRDAGGAVEGLWYECVVAQDWYVADPGFGAAPETKDRRQYFATLQNGATTLQAYFGDLAQTQKILHPYHSAWSTVQRTGASKGLPFWIAGTKAQPTLWAEIDAAYWCATGGIVPPYDVAKPIQRDLSAYDYNPGSSFQWQANIDNTGGSLNRGWLTAEDVIRLAKQTEGNDREWRTHALAGLHCPGYRLRNHLTSTGIGDVTNLPIPWQTQTLSSTAAGGMVTTELTTLGARQIHHSTNPANRTLTYGAYSSSLWGSRLAGWNPGADASHAPPWGYFPALLTGRRCFRETAIDTGFSLLCRTVNSSVQKTLRETSYGQRQNRTPPWPVRYSTPYPEDLQVRGTAWQTNVIVHAWRVAEDGSELKSHLREILDVHGAAQRFRRTHIEAQASPIQKDRRFWYQRDNTDTQVFEINFLTGCLVRAAMLLGDSTDWTEVADFVAARPIKVAASAYPLTGQAFQVPAFRKNDAVWNPATGNDYRAGDYVIGFARVVSGATDVIQLRDATGGADSTHKNSCPPTVGDQIEVGFKHIGENPPAQLDIAATYHIVEVLDTRRFRIAASAGGAPITGLDVTATTGSGGERYFAIWYKAPQAFLNKTDVLDPALRIRPYTGGDDYFHINHAALCWALRWAAARPTQIMATAGEVTTAAANAAAVWASYQPDLQAFGPSSGFNPSWIMALP